GTEADSRRKCHGRPPYYGRWPVCRWSTSGATARPLTARGRERGDNRTMWRAGGDREGPSARRAALPAVALLLGLVATARGLHAQTTIFIDGFESGNPCAWSFSTPYAETFPGVDGAAWPAPWTVAG